jgi:hypothetical protein
MISPALTLGQEVGRCYCCSGKFTKNGVIDWTDLGEWQNPISEEKQENQWIWQRQRWSLMTVLYLLVRTSCYILWCDWLLCWLQNGLDTLYWNTIFCVCFGGQHIDAVLIYHLMISINALSMSHMCCVWFFWPAAHRRYAIGLGDRCSKYSVTLISTQWLRSYIGVSDS